MTIAVGDKIPNATSSFVTPAVQPDWSRAAA